MSVSPDAPPFWSVDRGEYVQAGSLEIGERLQTLSGDVKVVQQKLPRPGPQPVFNLEVHDEHVYFIGRDGVLVHNNRNEVYNGSASTLVRNGLPELKGSYLDAFDIGVRLRTFKQGDRVYRSPNMRGPSLEPTDVPGPWFSTRATKTRIGTESQSYIKAWGNPLEELRVYEFTTDVTVYYGKVANGKGYQLLFPRDVDAASVLKFTEGWKLK